MRHVFMFVRVCCGKTF